jgi:TRAP-type C4-dicarboxylate transport system permease small subunit
VSDATASARASRPVALLMAVERRVTQVAVGAAVCLFAAASLVGFYQVITRFILNEPATWSETLVRTLLIWMVYLGLSSAVRIGALVSVDVVYRACRGRARRALEAAIALATLALLLILFWYGCEMVYRVRFQNLASLEIPVSYAYAAIPTGALLSILAVLAHYFDPRRQELETAV